MRRRPPNSTRTDTLFPYTTLVRSQISLRVSSESCRDYTSWFAVSFTSEGPRRSILPERRGPFNPSHHQSLPPVKNPTMVGPHTAVIRVATTNAVANSEENTSELQSVMRISYAVFCLKKNKTISKPIPHHIYKHTLANRTT